MLIFANLSLFGVSCQMIVLDRQSGGKAIRLMEKRRFLDLYSSKIIIV